MQYDFEIETRAWKTSSPYADSRHDNQDEFRTSHELADDVGVLTERYSDAPCRSCAVSRLQAALGEHRGAKTVRGNGAARNG